MMQPDFISRLKSRYRDCDSYEDLGLILRTTSGQLSEQRSAETLFKTQFRRQELFDYNWTDPTKGEFRVWSENQRTHISSPRGGTSEVASIAAALSEARGISLGGTMLVPALLLCPGDVNTFLDIERPKVSEREIIDGSACNVLVGSFEEADEIKIWISDDFVLRKVRRRMHMSTEKQKLLLSEASRVTPAFPQQLPLEEYTLVQEYSYREIKMSP